MTSLPTSRSSAAEAAARAAEPFPTSATIPIAASRYRLVAELGRGGMASVFLAVTDGMGGGFSKLVVVKQLREHLAKDPDFVTMFLDEARIAARLNHPNVVQTLDSGQAHGELFIAMEYLDGQPLQRITARARASLAGGLPLASHLAILSDALAGLHYAHELSDFDGTPLRLVHRDVTPHNLFVTYDGQVKVVDFGIARAEGRASQTRHGIIKGKLPYMAPEQARADVVDRRADVFAVGVMLFEALTGTRLWGDAPDKAIFRKLIAGDVPRSPRAVRPDVADTLDAICQRALAPRRDDRYPTALAMQQDIEAVLEADLRRPSGRGLGAEVASLFEDRRELTKRVIESQLAHLATHARVTVVALAPPGVDGARSEHEEITARLDSKETRIGAPDPELLAEISEHKAKGAASERRLDRPRRGRKLAIGGAVALAVLVVALAVRMGSDPSADDLTVTVTLRATPGETRFRIDDGPELPNPYVGRVPRDDRAHKLTIEIPGEPAREQPLRLSEDVSLRLMLSR